MSMEIIKQLYDIGNLLDMANDAGIIKSTFFRFAEVELAYRNQNKLNAGDVLEDIFQTALCISTRGDDGKGDFEQLQSGIQRLGRFIFSESYHLEKAIPHAAKAAYLSRLIATNQKTIEKFENPAQVADAVIGAPHHPRLQKLKKTNPEAFFYWWKAINL